MNGQCINNQCECDDGNFDIDCGTISENIIKSKYTFIFKERGYILLNHLFMLKLNISRVNNKLRNKLKYV